MICRRGRRARYLRLRANSSRRHAVDWRHWCLRTRRRRRCCCCTQDARRSPRPVNRFPDDARPPPPVLTRCCLTWRVADALRVHPLHDELCQQSRSSDVDRCWNANTITCGGEWWESTSSLHAVVVSRWRAHSRRQCYSSRQPLRVLAKHAYAFGLCDPSGSIAWAYSIVLQYYNYNNLLDFIRIGRVGKEWSYGVFELSRSFVRNDEAQLCEPCCLSHPSFNNIGLLYRKNSRIS